jgi:ComF family protein
MSFFRYKGPVRQAIKLLKYKFVSDLTEEFISLIPFSSLHSTMKQYSNVAILIPIPLHPSRLRFRGFNQAEVLGKLLAERLNIPMKTDILKRIRKTTPQVEVKDRKKRLKNMENAFSVNNLAMKQCSNLPAGKAGVTILLFDDVFTTGGTLRAAANVLKRAGVKRVWGLVLAHG